MAQKRISIGYPFDILFDRENPISGYTKYDEKEEYVIFPDKEDNNHGAIIYDDRSGDIGDSSGRFTGNIVIRGRPGTGKSTLALQIAVASTLSRNRKYAAYVSLEEDPEKIELKAKSFGWDKYIYPVCQLQNLNQFSTPDNLAEALQLLLTQPKDCPQLLKEVKDNTESSNYRVIVPRLSPRSLELSDEQSTSLFWERYLQLERLLSAARTLRTHKNEIKHCTGDNSQIPKELDLRIVIIDSLNTMGNHLLTREELFRIFDLFKRYETIGIFIVEEDEGQVASPDSRLHADTIEYLADMVVALSVNYDNDYFVRYFEIVKSRYQHQVYGKHTFKIGGQLQESVSQKEVQEKKDGQTKLFRKEYFYDIGLFPLISLHHTVISTERIEEAPRIKYEIKIGNFNKLLQKELPDNPILTLEGPRGTFKSTLALNILIDGLLQGETVILIRLRDRPFLQTASKFPLDRSLFDLFKETIKLKTPEDLWQIFNEKDVKKTDLKKYNINHWTNPLNNSADFIELDFKSGNLFPEEFIEILRRIYFLLKKASGKEDSFKCRIVLDDVGLIGVSYPFLQRSHTASDLFLTAFVHLMRNYNINLTLVGTTGQYPESDHIVQKAKILANAVLTLSYCDVFGDRYVTIMGEGQRVGMREKTGVDYSESVPAIIEPGEKLFSINTERLEGLVGFDRGHIHRPGLSLQLFEGGDIQAEYNKEVLKLVRCAFGLSEDKSEKYTIQAEYGDPSVNLVSFDAKDADAVYRSPDILHDRPIANTVIRTVDEFLEEDKSLLQLKDNTRRSKPYYKNVLFIAYDKSLFSGENNRKLLALDNGMFWEQLKNIIDYENKSRDKRKLYLGYDWYTSETLNCSLLDILRPKMFHNGIIRPDFKIKKYPNILTEIFSFQQLIRENLLEFEKNKCRPENKECLPHESGVWLCWYSQLREMLDKFKKDIKGEDICVKALPNGGFRGDWFIGIVQGSVSYKLGENVINILTSKEEQYKRFSKGVGMPVEDEFFYVSKIKFIDEKISLCKARKGYIKIDPEYFGWPLGFSKNKNEDSEIYYRTLTALNKIHTKASSRKDFIEYQKYRSAIEKIVRQLAEGPWEKEAEIKEKIQTIIQRMPHQIAMLMAEP